MWSTIENFRESLSQITSDVLDTAEELDTGGSEPGGTSDGSVTSSSRHVHRPLHAAPEGDSTSLHLNAKENGVKNSSDMANGSHVNVRDLQLQMRKLQAREKDLLSKVSGNKATYASLNDAHARALAEISEMKDLLEKEKANLASATLRHQRDAKTILELNRETKRLKTEKQKMSMEIMELQHRLNEQTAENNNAKDHSRAEAIKEMELESIIKDEKVERLQALVKDLETRNSQLQTEVKRLRHQQALSNQDKQRDDGFGGGQLSETKSSSKQLEDALRAVEERFDIERKDFDNKLEVVRMERDKALRDLKRLKQHLIEKEQMDSEKMEQDIALIAELKEKAEASSMRAMQLEQILSQMNARQTDLSKKATEQLEEANQEIANLKKKLAACSSALESKDSELLNLQAALGQYYAESEAKDRLHAELLAVRKELSLLSDNLKTANDIVITKNIEINELQEKFAWQQRKFSENQEKTLKLEADILMLRRALEQSLTRLNRMSSDSDYYVDRRIVIKLLVTYFQRHQSKEVLDLMSRMLGFSEDDKQAIGFAQQGGGKGVVRGVLGLPGRVVGGLLKSGSSPSVASLSQTDNQSFADLWIDFLLKESEERERREAVAAEANSLGDQKQEQPGNVSNGPTLMFDQKSDLSANEFSSVPLSSTASTPFTRGFVPSRTSQPWQ